MSFKRLCLIAGLLALPSAYAQAADITIVVPVSLSNVPAFNRHIAVKCQVGVGVGPTTVPNASWPHATHIGTGINGVGLSGDSGRGTPLRARITVPIMPESGRSLDDATHYKCTLVSTNNEPVLAAENEVSGAIPRPPTARPISRVP